MKEQGESSVIGRFQWRGDGLAVDWPRASQMVWPTSRIFDCLSIVLRLDGQDIRFNGWQALENGEILATRDGVELSIKCSPSGSVRVRAINRSSKSWSLDAFVFRAEKGPDEDFLSTPGRHVRVFREGWTMASAVGSVGFGDSDFLVNPEYKPFAVSAPSEYEDDCPNRFSGEYVTMLREQRSGVCVLAGFISSADQFTRFKVALETDGIASFEALAVTDGVEFAPGGELVSEEFVILAGDDGYSLLQEFGSRWGRRMGALGWSHLPTGWCSWYYYFEHVTERDVLENVVWLAERRKEFPLEYIQIDDGYQSALGDWLSCDSKKFPGGLEYLAREIRDSDFKPGLWLAPFMVEERSELFRDHPNWVIRDSAGEPVWVTHWRGSRVAALDTTVAEAEQWLTHIFEKISAMGFEYVKLDFLMYACSAVALGGRYMDRKATRAQALRRGLAAIRRGMISKFILGCTSPLGPEVGLVNGARIGTDITPYWRGEGEFYKEAPCVVNVCRNVISRAYMNGRLWINDPDTHVARTDDNRLTEDEVLLWTSALWITGGLLLLGDRLASLEPRRARLSRLLLQNLGSYEDARPLDFLEREYPALWTARCTREFGKMALAVFNFEDSEQTFRIDPTKVMGVCRVTEYWLGEDLGKLTASFDCTVRPHACRLFILSPN